MDLVQDILIYATCLFLLLSIRQGLSGAAQVRRFEQKHLNLLRLASALVYLNAAIGLGLVVYELMMKREPPVLSKVGAVVLLSIGMWINLGIGKIRNSLTHGKKFTVLAVCSGVALLMMLLLLSYLKFRHFESFVF